MQLEPRLATAQFHLGSVLNQMGRLDEGLVHMRRAVELAPRWLAAHNAVVHLSHFVDDPRVVTDELAAWNRRHAEPLRAERIPLRNLREPDRALKIGYVSAYFRRHPTAYFLAPLLRNHDPRMFQVFAYSDLRQPDVVTAQMRQSISIWRDTADLDDAELATLIREDGIDILVDTMMHLEGSRLPAFARKPAPVQVSWVAYPGTSGVDAMDYRISDPWLEPPGGENEFHPRNGGMPVRLPDCFWCYDPLGRGPAVNPLPARRNGWVTFGSLNTFLKVNERTLALWSQLLGAVENSRLILLAPPGGAQTRVQELLQRGGVASDRIEFVGPRPKDEYLELHHKIDLLLDPVPSGGQTTLCDGLWMGLPAVTLAGRTPMGRGGVSLLANAGLAEFVARNKDEYVRIAVEAARDLDGLAALRRNLRSRLEASPLMNGPRFAANMEAVYREIWRRWCASEGA